MQKSVVIDYLPECVQLPPECAIVAISDPPPPRRSLQRRPAALFSSPDHPAALDLAQNSIIPSLPVNPEGKCRMPSKWTAAPLNFGRTDRHWCWSPLPARR